MLKIETYLTIAALCVAMSATNCRKEPPPDPPPPIDQQQDSSVVFLNNKISDFVADFSNYPNSNAISCGFRQRRGGFVNHFYLLGAVELTKGEYGKYLDFFQVYGYDQINHKYVLDTTLTPYFEITAVDKIEKRIKGAFEARFYRTVTGLQTADSALPDTLWFKGTFNTVWREY